MAKKTKETKAAEASTKIKTDAVKKQEENKDDLRVDPSITNDEAEKADVIAEDQKATKTVRDLKDQEITNAMEGFQVDNKKVQNVTVKESKELKAALKKDAEKRKKSYSECPITGVIVVS